MSRYRHNTIRNSLAELKKRELILRYGKGYPAFYVLPEWLKEKKLVNEKVLVTHGGMGGGGHTGYVLGHRAVRQVALSLASFLGSVGWDRLRHVHDVRLSFVCAGFWRSVNGCVGWSLPASSSFDVCRVDAFVWGYGREARVTVHRTDNVEVFLRCADFPVEVSDKELFGMVAFLGGVRHDLIRHGDVPQVGSWTVVSWHYGLDGCPPEEMLGNAFSVTTFDELSSTYLRLYLSKEREKARVEAVEKPNKPLSEALRDLLSPELKVAKLEEDVTVLKAFIGPKKGVSE